MSVNLGEQTPSSRSSKVDPTDGSIGRRAFLKTTISSLSAATLVSPLRARIEAEFDLVVKGASIIDGTGTRPWLADVGIRGDRITSIGSIPGSRSRRVIEARGYMLTPGFIDIHTHSDDSIFRYPNAESRVFQGITTEVTGNCGSSVAPAFGHRKEDLFSDLREDLGIELEWSSVDSYLSTLDDFQIAVNHALLLGHGGIRESIAGPENRSLTPDELSAATRVIEEGMEEGAFGLSTGLEYTPGRFTPPAEIAALAAVVSRYGGIYATHIRNEETRLLEAIAEAIQVGRQTNVRVEISHLKAAGRMNWDKQFAALQLIESARRSGVNVLADAYPYEAYSTGLSIFLPDWAVSGGWEQTRKRLQDSAGAREAAEFVHEQVSEDPGSFEQIVISSVRRSDDRRVIGRNLAEIAKGRNLEPSMALVQLLLDNDGSVGFVGFGMSMNNVDQVVSHSLVMVGSDGSSIAPEGPAAESRPHPRNYGAFAKVLGEFVRDRRILDLTSAVRKMTSIPADQVGISDRGRIATGKMADIIVFDEKQVEDRATFEEPHKLSVGIREVIVNGQLVVHEGQHTGARPGKALRRG